MSEMTQTPAPQLIACSTRLPTKDGVYRIKNNSGCNNGDGMMRYDLESGWDVPKIIRSFYRVVGWYEN